MELLLRGGYRSALYVLLDSAFDGCAVSFRALKPEVIAIGTGFGVVSFALLSVLGLPILLIFGFVRSLTVLPHFVVRSHRCL